MCIVTGPPTEPGLPGHAGERLHYVFVQVDTDADATTLGVEASNALRVSALD